MIREIRKYSERNENENTTYPDMDVMKAVLGENSTCKVAH